MICGSSTKPRGTRGSASSAATTGRAAGRPSEGSGRRERGPPTKRLDDLAVRTLAERIANHLAQARLRFTRKAPLPLHSTGSVGAELLRRASRRTRTGKQVCPGRREALRV